MVEYVLTEGRLRYPGACVCGSQQMPLVDTLREFPTQGGEGVFRVYLCPMCVGMAARLLGWRTGEDYDAVADEADVLHRRVEGLTLELEAERRPGAKVISVDDLGEVMRRAQVAS